MRGHAVSSPRITADGWGHITVDGRTFKDAKLWPGGSRAWNWTETGTDHEAGIQPADVRELLYHGAEYVLLSRGRQGRLRVHPDTEALLNEIDVAHEILLTDEAIRRYQALREDGTAVGALIHTTC
jgi:hypothetical protein